MIGLDTSAIIDMFKGNPQIIKTLDNIDEPIATNIIIYMEIMNGLDSTNQKHKQEEKFYDEFFDDTMMFNLDIQSCKKLSEIVWKLKKNGNLIGQLDCAIAGIYLKNGINKIITKNVKHFEKTGLKVISY